MQVKEKAGGIAEIVSYDFRWHEGRLQRDKDQEWTIGPERECPMKPAKPSRVYESCYEGPYQCFMTMMGAI